MHKLKLHVAVTSGDRGAICMKQMYYCICCNFIEFFSHSKLFGYAVITNIFCIALGIRRMLYAIQYRQINLNTASKLKYGKQAQIPN